MSPLDSADVAKCTHLDSVISVVRDSTASLNAKVRLKIMSITGALWKRMEKMWTHKLEGHLQLLPQIAEPVGFDTLNFDQWS